MTTRPEQIATRTTDDDLAELRLDRIAIEGQIVELDAVLERMIAARAQLDEEIAKTERKRDDQKARRRARIEAIYQMEIGE